MVDLVLTQLVHLLIMLHHKQSQQIPHLQQHQQQIPPLRPILQPHHHNLAHRIQFCSTVSVNVMLLVSHGLEILVFAVLLVHIRKEILVIVVCSSVRIVNLLLFVSNVMMDIPSTLKLIPVKKYLSQLYQNLHQHQPQLPHRPHLLPLQPPPTQL